MLTPQQIEEARQKYGITPVNQSAAPDYSGGLQAAWAAADAQKKIDNPFPKNPLQRIADGQGKDNIEVSKGALKRGIRDIASVGVQANPILHNIMIKRAPELQAAFDAFDEAITPTNDAQKEGALNTSIAEMAIPTGGAAKAAATVTKSVVKGTAAKVQTANTPKISPSKALGQIAQGKPKHLSSVARTLEAVDTTGVKTYQDLHGRIKDTIPALAKKVDTELLKDPKAYPLDELAAKGTTKGGQEVKTDFISRALTDLSTLYKSIGDDVARTEIDELIEYASKNGLTRKEVNDIARVYGEEFGSKAFSKMGEPLTGTNAQAFETTRTGLKGVARQGLGGDEAKALDSTLSALYDTEKLVQKNVDAVAKLQQRIQERKLVEKAGYYISKYTDILTGGAIRGLVGGILPRGAGYKTMNALDIEEALSKNLAIVNKALKAKTDDELIAILEKGNPTFKASGPKAASQ